MFILPTLNVSRSNKNNGFTQIHTYTHTHTHTHTHTYIYIYIYIYVYIHSEQKRDWTWISILIIFELARVQCFWCYTNLFWKLELSEIKRNTIHMFNVWSETFALKYAKRFLQVRSCSFVFICSFTSVWNHSLLNLTKPEVISFSRKNLITCLKRNISWNNYKKLRFVFYFPFFFLFLFDNQKKKGNCHLS